MVRGAAGAMADPAGPVPARLAHRAGLRRPADAYRCRGAVGSQPGHVPAVLHPARDLGGAVHGGQGADRRAPTSSGGVAALWTTRSHSAERPPSESRISAHAPPPVAEG